MIWTYDGEIEENPLTDQIETEYNIDLKCSFKGNLEKKQDLF